ncbi:HEAT repeat [Singulisphaera sp. GP187]|uniref:HEAT repeat domain-containing protein n=1 Tax=Singulisphaera sp. GP187 TaxID=1882752 RepID=UPI0009282938|nr:HEAT repeat domain-containing protein [Singulisphaera sp. GP187]SIO29926.1 HEAT repeat [Singulisphaera sp. GP187]
MSYHISLRFAVCLFVLSTSPGFGQQAPDPEALPNNPDKLVASMAGEHLPSAAKMRVISKTPGWHAAKVLVSLKDDAVPALAKGLESEDRTIRLNTVFVLSQIGTPAALRLLIKSVSDSDPEIRALAVAGLPTYKSDEARQAVLRTLKDPAPAVRNAAIMALQPREEKPDNQIRFATASVLIPLLDDATTQYAAVDVLGKLGMNIAALPLVKRLKSEDKSVRSAVARALGQLKDNQVAMQLTDALRDSDRYVRMYAANSLGEIGDLRTTPALVKLLSGNESFLRRDAAIALGKIGDLRAVPRLLPLLEDPEEMVRFAAAEALGQIGDPRAVEPLCRSLLRTGRDHSSVARALGRLRDPHAIKPLTDYLLNDEMRPDGFREAVNALAQIHHPDAVAAIVKVILNTRNDLVGPKARQALRDVIGISFAHEPTETIAKWWDLNREDHLRPIPEKE